MARLIQIQIHNLFDSQLMDFESAGEGKSDGAGRIALAIGTKGEGTEGIDRLASIHS